MSTIVIDARELRTSSGRYVEKLIAYLQDLDKKNSYKLLLKPKDIEGLLITNNNFEKIPCAHKEFSFAEQIDFKKQINDLKPDLVHFTFAQQPVLYSGPKITTFHDLTTLRFFNPDKNFFVFSFKQKVYAWVIRRVARKSKQIIVPSNYVRDDLVDFTRVNEDKVNVTYEAADPIRDKAEAIKELSGSKFIMYIGRPTPHKNLERLIEAHQSLLKDMPRTKLVLAGKEDDNYRRIRRSSEKKGYKDIIYTGFLSEGQLRWMYENCQAYVFPSLSEGFGLPGLEAMTHGAPVVSSNATCLPEIYGDAAEYFDPNDVDDMKEAISNVLNDSKLRSQLIYKGTKRAGLYSWGKLANQTLDIYNKVLKDN
jgi:glycosyltransferase involved in cell wall biosynthesis